MIEAFGIEAVPAYPTTGFDGAHLADDQARRTLGALTTCGVPPAHTAGLQHPCARCAFPAIGRRGSPPSMEFDDAHLVCRLSPVGK
ncbi:hypothetical protein [Thioalkalivibrio sp. HK1]|uniref:hypothetical protein n=1 Tax=Thioalkalivibrio sp. HK1 TaxID=1469245 RepID=UPI0012DFE0EE|nr:hypothetical protein [Thioalkalivibrio sp. HK1]